MSWLDRFFVRRADHRCEPSPDIAQLSRAISVRPIHRWGVMWRSTNKLDGEQCHLMFRTREPALFKTRKEAREWIAAEYGYVANRHDLQDEPHGWKMPVPVKVTISISSAIKGVASCSSKTRTNTAAISSKSYQTTGS